MDNKTAMVNPPKTIKKMVMIETKKAVRLADREVPPGTRVEVSEEEAAEFCRPIPGSYSFFGERMKEEEERHSIVRAVRV